jgi:hypothetical protein
VTAEDRVRDLCTEVVLARPAWTLPAQAHVALDNQHAGAFPGIRGQCQAALVSGSLDPVQTRVCTWIIEAIDQA